MSRKPNRFTVAVHYIIAKCGDPRKLGSTKLNKILWFADVYAYRFFEESITGSKYLRRQYGPVPEKILRVLEQLENEGKISINKKIAVYDPVIYTSLESPDISALSEDQIGLLNSLIDQICNGYSANEISHVSHDDVWKAAIDGEEIPLNATLMSESANCTPEVLSWASQVIAEHE